MKKAIPALYGSYGRYIDEFRAIPSIDDCLKWSERRVLYTLHKLAAQKLTKSARVVGECIGKYHPHGDASTYDVLVNMVRRGFAIGQGNFGSEAMTPVPPAAYRYTEVKLQPLVEKLVFDLIKYVPYSDPEALDELQPNWLCSPVPIGLIGDNIISGISFNTTKMPRYTFIDLFNRLTNIFQRQVDPNIPPLTILPNFPNFDIYEEQPGELEKILTTGEGKLLLRPKYMVDGYGVHVYGRPPSGCSSWLKDDTDEVKIKYSCSDLSAENGFEVLFSPKNGARLNDDFINMVLKVIDTKISFQCNVWDGAVVLKSIDELLLRAYDNWSNCLKAQLKEKEDAIKQTIREMLVIEVIRYLINTYNIKLQTLDDLYNTFLNLPQPLPASFAQDVTIDEVKDICKKHSIRKLFEYHVDRQSALNEIAIIEGNLNNFGVYAYNMAKEYLPN